MGSVSNSVRQFCLIQVQVLKDREQKLRKELLDCKIQQEYLTSVLQDITPSDSDPDDEELATYVQNK
jgi:hypothetical protein|tara:strand:+ start:227 stop:427 length:201 start_codon:yes stop_codon:yes gene_type:complete